MKTFAYALVASTIMAGAAMAQTTAPATSPGTSPMAAPSTMAAPGTTTGSTGMGSSTGMGTSTGTGMGTTGRNGVAAASGNDNQAVATTAANAPMPAKGSNSFTMGEARRRIAARGFTSVANLKKDGNGVWRGTAQKGGASTPVWLDYKGNVGQASS